MREQKINKTEIIEFESLNEFGKYIESTPINNSFRWEKLQSTSNPESFAGTKSFEETINLFKHGWQEKSKELTQRLKVKEKESTKLMVKKQKNDVCGYQALVPLYLQGVPNNMLNTRIVPMKKKVITLNKNISYSSNVESETIMKESIKALQIIKKLEAQGYRVNLNLIMPLVGYKNKANSNLNYVIKIRLKSGNEKLNISKLSFPLVHPSMLRRLLFRFLEIYPTVPKGYVGNYGVPMRDEETKKYLNDEYLIPAFIHKDIKLINGIEDL